MEEGATSGSAAGPAAITNTEPAATEVGASKTLEAAAATCEQTKALTKFGPMLKKLAMEISMVEMQP